MDSRLKAAEIRLMKKIVPLFIFTLALGAGTCPAFNLPLLKRGVVLRRDNRARGSYTEVLRNGNGPGLLITFPFRETVSSAGAAIRLSGRVSLPARVAISGKPARVYPSGAFVGYLPLSPGENIITVTARDGGGRTDYSFKLKGIAAPSKKSAGKKLARPRRGVVIRPHTPLQLKPGGTRLLTLPERTVLKITARGENYFTAGLSDSLSASVAKENVRLEGAFPPLPFLVGNVVFEPDRGRVSFECQTSVPARLEYISPDELRLIFYDSILGTEEINLADWKGGCRWEASAGGEAVFHLRGPLNCYRWNIEYREGAYRLELKGKPRKKKGVRLLIDPGHGGSETGAVSPCGIEEKEVNLRLAREVRRLLRKRGYDCFLSRTGDRRLGLYERTELAREKGADILLSLHFNAAGENRDPRKKSGCSVFYYNPPSRELAGALYRRLVDCGLKGDGVRWKSLAVIRPPGRIGVLAEIAYLTNPEEEGRLFRKGYLARIAAALADGLEEYIR